MAVSEIQDVLVAGNNIAEFIAEEAIVAGQAVAYNATGVSSSVLVAVKGTTGQPVGVAIKTAAITTKVKVAMNGCIVKVTSDNAAIDAGDIIEDLGTTDPGEVGPLDTSVGAAAIAELRYQIGIARDDIAANAIGNILVNCGRVTVPNTA